MTSNDVIPKKQRSDWCTEKYWIIHHHLIIPCICFAAVPPEQISDGMWNNIPLLAPTQRASPVITEPCVCNGSSSLPLHAESWKNTITQSLGCVSGANNSPFIHSKQAKSFTESKEFLMYRKWCCHVEMPLCSHNFLSRFIPKKDQKVHCWFHQTKDFTVFLVFFFFFFLSVRFYGSFPENRLLSGHSVSHSSDWWSVFAAVMVDLLELSSIWTQARAQPAWPSCFCSRLWPRPEPSNGRRRIWTLRVISSKLFHSLQPVYT